MAFCCCKKSKHVEDGEGKEVQTGLLHSQEEHEQPSTTLKTKPGPIVSMRVTGVVEVGERHATGVAKLPGSIYVLCKNPSSIVIHRDVSPFDCTDEVSLEDLEAPYDLASNISSSCLYLTDCTTNSVYKMTSPTNEVSPWLKDIGYPHTLTVTSPKVEVLLLRYGSPSSLEIYGTDAVKVRSIQIPDEIEYPKHAVRNSGGNYVVSGKAKGVTETWGVFEMTVDGEILRRLTASNHLTESYHLAIDSADRLFVVDCLKHRLLIVDAQLSRSEELLPKENNKPTWPWRLHYAANDKQVLVLQHHLYMFRGVANGEKDDTSEEKTKETIGEDKKTQDGGENDTEKASTVEEKKAGTEEEEEKDEEDKATANGTVTEKDDEDKKRGDEEKEKKGEEKDKKGEEKDNKDEEKDKKDEEKDKKDEEKDKKDEENDKKDEEKDKKDEGSDKKAEEYWEHKKKAGKHNSVVYIYSYV